MLHIHHVNLQPIVGGGEVYTRALTRALLEAGARVTLYVHPRVALWDGMQAERLELVRVSTEHELLARLPTRGATILTQSPVTPECVRRLASVHRVAGFAHMPMVQRSAEALQPYHLVFTVSQYCIDLLRQAGLRQLYPQPIYGTADLSRSSAPIVRRSPYIVDPRKFRDVLLGQWNRLAGMRPVPFQRRAGLTLGVVSLIAPIKQLPELFSIVAPGLARHPQVNVEIFGAGGYAQVRDLRRALAPLGERARFWGYQTDVGAIYPQLDYLMTGLPEKEALGLNAIEAQACGTPVLAPNAPPFTETVVDGAGGFLYSDPRQDGGRHFGELIGALLGGRARPDPRIAAADSLARFTHAALVHRARGIIDALTGLTS